MDVGEVYDLLARCGFEEIRQRLPWMADMALRWRRGTARSWRMGGLSTASATAIAEGFCFLGAVGTVPEARGRGLAGQLVTYIALQQQAEGREVWLSCGEGLAGFYESIGFARAGEMVTMQKEGGI
jgi:GNAT superfamily N-acetyltransferase